jgi:S-adenosylmethionine-dependent methyltransferase
MAPLITRTLLTCLAVNCQPNAVYFGKNAGERFVMSVTAEEFDSVIDEWKEWQTLPWGKLFYSTSRHNIQRHLGGKPLRILDVGGGNGADSIYFARQGHTVTLVDYSSEMLAQAKNAAEEEGVVGKITFCQSDAAQIGEIFAGEAFDLILCNLMIEFVPDPPALLRQIGQLLAPGGLLSLIDGNRYSEPYKCAVLQGNLAAAIRAIGRKDYPHRWFNRDVPIYSADEMIRLLQDAGLAPVGQYGIWSMCHYLPNERKFEAQYYAELEELEFRLSDVYPYYLIARFYQIIATKAQWKK